MVYLFRIRSRSHGLSFPHPFPFFVLHHTLVQFLRSPVKEIGAAAVFPSLDGGIGVIALAVFDFQPEYTGEVPQQFPHAGFSSIDIFQCVKSVQQFYQVHGAARQACRLSFRLCRGWRIVAALGCVAW